LNEIEQNHHFCAIEKNVTTLPVETAIPKKCFNYR